MNVSADHVSTVSMLCMGAAGLLALLIPFALLIYFRKKKDADIVPFIAGAAVFVLFALILEGGINYAVSRTSFFEKLQNNVWLYAAYGGLMAGIFEEFGRLFAFKVLLKKRMGNDANALMYGAGHGGMEAILVFGVTMGVNIVLSLLINSGNIGAVFSDMPKEIAPQVEKMLGELCSNPGWAYGLGLIERIISIAAHIGLSVIVWFSVKRKKPALFILALLLHAAMDFITAVCTQKLELSALKTEVVLLVCAAAICLTAFVVWKGCREKDTAEV
ncbi:MAG: YhfC family intramembrane metalloprotease [Clostridia bacterium]|nr:YhfC family intramembrane metalloprotease [Clostridia bacterium]